MKLRRGKPSGALPFNQKIKTKPHEKNKKMMMAWMMSA